MARRNRRGRADPPSAAPRARPPAPVGAPPTRPPAVDETSPTGAVNPTPLRLWRRLDPGWRLALTLLVVQRLVLGAIGFHSAVTADHFKLPGDPWPNFPLRGGEPWSLLLTSWHHWDAIRYYELVQVGYADLPQTAMAAGLYPLYPLLVQVASFPLGGNVLLTELAVSSAAFVIGLRALYGLVQFESTAAGTAANRPGSRQSPPSGWAWATVLLVALFPTGFFLLAPYTESLFFALTVASLWYARQGNWWLAGAAGFLAALTRLPGAFLALPLLFEYCRQRQLVPWIQGRGGRAPSWAMAAAALPLLAMVVVPLAIAVLRGSPRALWAFETAQFWVERLLGMRSAAEVLGQFRYRVVPPWEALSASLAYVTGGVARPPASLPSIEAVNLAAAVLFLVLGVLVTRRLPFAYSLYVWPSLIMLLTRQVAFSPLMSVSRYVLVIVPCFMLLGALLAHRQGALVAWLLASAVLQGILLWYFARAGFVA